MSHISKEILADYLAGRLPEEARKVIEASAVWDADLRARIAEARQSQIGKCPASTDATQGTTNLTETERSAGRARALTAGLPLILLCVACAALFAAGLAAWQLHFPHINEGSFALRDGFIDERTHLSHALEDEQNHERSMLPNAEGYVKPLSVFKDTRGKYCREFELSYFGGQRFSGVACRVDRSRWSVEVLASQGDAESGADEAFRPASDRAAELIATALHRIKAQPALSEQAVGELIRRKWNTADQ